MNKRLPPRRKYRLAREWAAAVVGGEIAFEQVPEGWQEHVRWFIGRIARELEGENVRKKT